MGVLNVTPDSFSDGGRFFAPQAAIAQAQQMVAEGAEIIDVGAESTRPGSDRVPPGEQIDRLREVLPAAVASGALVSIDTTRAAVAEFALDAGAVMVNDVSAGRDDPELLPVVGRRGVPIVLMHMLGRPKTMQNRPEYKDVVTDVRRFLVERIEAAVSAGVARERVIVDPGIGFGKRLEHNLTLLGNLGALAALGRPVLVGPSRKSFIGHLTGEQDPSRRLGGTLAACLAAWRQGASLFRVHDVAAVRQAIMVTEGIEKTSRS